MTGSEIGEMLPPAKKCQELPKAVEEGFFPRAFGGSMALPHFDSRLPASRSVKQ